MADNVVRDQNRITGLLAESTAGDKNPVPLQADPTTKRLKVESTISGGLGKLVTEDFDYIAGAYPDTDTEVYTFYTGGSGGTLVATITVNYTDSTKANILNVTRT